MCVRENRTKEQEIVIEINIVNSWAVALVQWLWEETHVPKVVGLNPGTGYWMDMTFFTLICCKNCIACLKRPKINKKEAGFGPFLKNIVSKRERDNSKERK